MSNLVRAREQVLGIRYGYLIGTSYCGSTLAAFLADSHPEIASVGETAPNRKVRRRGAATVICSCGRTVEDCRFWRNVFERVNSDGYSLSPVNWCNDYRYLNPILHRLLSTYHYRPSLRAIQHSAAQVLLPHRRRVERTNRVIVSFVRAVLAETKSTVFFETRKRPLRAWQLNRIPEFDMRFVRVIRDVRAFVLSKKRKGVPPRQAAEDWRRFQLGAEQFLSTVSPDRVLTVRYEDLTGAPQQVMDSVYRFLGVAPVELPVEIDPSAHHILGNNNTRMRGTFRVEFNEKWKRALSKQEVDVALKTAGGLNEQYGYDGDDPPDTAIAKIATDGAT